MGKLAEQEKKLLEKGKGTFQEFKEFILRGNVVDMAVGVIVATAFNKIVSSLVDNILMPIMGVLTGGVNFETLAITVGEANVQYGIFVQNVIDFLIIAASVFVLLKAMQTFHLKKAEEPAAEEAPAPDPQVVVLEEIRDLLKSGK